MSVFSGCCHPEMTLTLLFSIYEHFFILYNLFNLNVGNGPESESSVRIDLLGFELVYCHRQQGAMKFLVNGINSNGKYVCK